MWEDDDEYKPYTERPDLRWATWRDLWMSLYTRPYAEAKFTFVTKWTKNPAWDEWEKGWTERIRNGQTDLPPPPRPSFFREEVEVEIFWVRQELEERREHLFELSKAQIKKASTRELLYWLQQARACGGWWSPLDKNSEYGHKFEDIKAELDQREHIPNKQEARAQRRAAALQHRKNKLRRPVAQR